MRVAQSEPHVDEPLDRDVISALLALSARQRAVVYLTYWLELNAAETAGIVNCSERTVERELGRARRVLEGKLS
jgi:RNA polymerase sigma factor (sigma-70 family)